MKIIDSREKLNIAIRNPLSGGGWNGLTIISLSVLTIAIAVALFTSSIVSLQNSSLDITIARILGLSKTGVFLSIVLERILVGVIGMLAGTMLGISLSNWILGFLDITADGTESIPRHYCNFIYINCSGIYIRAEVRYSRNFKEWKQVA